MFVDAPLILFCTIVQYLYLYYCSIFLWQNCLHTKIVIYSKVCQSWVDNPIISKRLYDPYLNLISTIQQQHTTYNIQHTDTAYNLTKWKDDEIQRNTKQTGWHRMAWHGIAWHKIVQQTSMTLLYHIERQNQLVQVIEKVFISVFPCSPFSFDWIWLDRIWMETSQLYKQSTVWLNDHREILQLALLQFEFEYYEKSNKQTCHGNGMAMAWQWHGNGMVIEWH